MKQNLLAAAGLLSLLVCFSCGQDNSLSDSQGNVYRTTRIAQQEWMASNLLLDVGEGCYCYDDDPQLCDEMGRLYTWDAAQEAAQRIVGWHLPSKAEWEELIKHCGDDSVVYHNIISDAVGFDPQWSGVRISTGEFKAREFQTVNYWSSSTADTNSTLAYSMAIMSNLRIISPHNYPKANACSVRLIKDD
jgi:uncharacterized protein (TIGR02145 family)